jgi:hypothetical protein
MKNIEIYAFSYFDIWLTFQCIYNFAPQETVKKRAILREEELAQQYSNAKIIDKKGHLNSSACLQNEPR